MKWRRWALNGFVEFFERHDKWTIFNDFVDCYSSKCNVDDDVE